MRLFVALTFPPHVHEALLRAQSALKKQGRGNFTREENLHLTLAFIGETDRIDEARAALREVSSPPAALKFDRLGAFDDLIWAGAELSPSLAALQRDVSERLKAHGFSLEKRVFRPHITLCRRFAPYVKRDIKMLEQALGGANCRAERVILMESLRIDGKLVYRPVETKKL